MVGVPVLDVRYQPAQHVVGMAKAIPMLILPAMGIVVEVIANNTRKPLWGYKSLVYSVIFLGFMSFVVWAHHMFLTGMGTAINAFLFSSGAVG